MEKIKMSGRDNSYKGKKGQLVGAALMATKISGDAKQFVSSFTSSVPKATQFLKRNWKPITTAAALGLGTYALLANRKSVGTNKKH